MYGSIKAYEELKKEIVELKEYFLKMDTNTNIDENKLQLVAYILEMLSSVNEKSSLTTPIERVNSNLVYFTKLCFIYQLYGGEEMINIENYKNIPQELKEHDQCIWFKIYKEVDKNGVIKSKKVPVCSITHKASEWNKNKTGQVSIKL